MTTDSTTVRAWIRAVSPAAADGLSGRWAAYEGCEVPVVTLHGAYSTGKTALLRRLLVDGGQPVPEWLSISGGPATFESREAPADGLILRDSPGVMPGAAGARDDLNNIEATAALLLTDAMILMFNPQLATSDRDWVRELLDQDWPKGSVQYVIGRFDLAIDPTDSPTGYAELAERKRSELRAILGLPADTPIHVIAQDPFGLTGASQTLDASVWDPNRDWDGVADLRASLQSLPPLPDLRAAAASRFWSTAASDVRAELLIQQQEANDALAFATSEERRQEQRLTRLSTIEDEAAVNLTRLVEDSTRTAVESEHSPDQARASLQADIEAWFTQTMAELDVLRAEVIGEAEQERSRPAFAQFMSFLDSLSALKSEPAASNADPLLVTLTNTVGDGLMSAFKSAIEADGLTIDEIKKAKAARIRDAQKAAATVTGSSTAAPTGGSARRTTSSAAKKAAESGSTSMESWTKAYEVSNSLLPLAKEMVSLLVQNYEDAKAAEASVARRRQIREQMHRTATAAAGQIMNAVQPSFDDVRQLIRGQAAPAVSTIAGLKRTLDQIGAWLADGPE